MVEVRGECMGAGSALDATRARRASGVGADPAAGWKQEA